MPTEPATKDYMYTEAFVSYLAFFVVFIHCTFSGRQGLHVHGILLVDNGHIIESV